MNILFIFIKSKEEKYNKNKAKNKKNRQLLGNVIYVKIYNLKPILIVCFNVIENILLKKKQIKQVTSIKINLN